MTFKEGNPMIAFIYLVKSIQLQHGEWLEVTLGEDQFRVAAITQDTTVTWTGVFPM
jgi:hypothetical protein